MSCAGQSKTTDTLCFPVEVIRKVLIAAEQKKILEQQVTILNDRIAGFQQEIKLLTDKDAETVASYDRQIAEMLEQRKVFEQQLKDFEKIVRKERRKRFWTAAGGVVTTGIAAYLYIIK